MQGMIEIMINAICSLDSAGACGGGIGWLLRIQMVDLMIMWRGGKLLFDFHNIVTVKPSAPLCSQWLAPCRGEIKENFDASVSK